MNRTMRLSSASRFRVSHSQTVSTFQPCWPSALTFRASRLWLPLNFRVQNSCRVEGNIPRLQLCRCQKHPCTKMTFRCLGKTMSGFPGKSIRCNRKRNPIRWISERTASSGAVLRGPMLAMISERFSREILSMISVQQRAGPQFRLDISLVVSDSNA